MATPPDFDDIRPYNDQEVRPTIERLLADNEFIDTISRLKMPNVGRFVAPLMRGAVRKAIIRETQQVQSVDAFQQRIEPYMAKVLGRTVSELTVSGLEHLERGKAYCFISNHRDIAMDPAFVNWVLYHNGFQTLRIAIGDNLLAKPFAADLMRLNKCFIVKRSLTSPREKLKAARNLSGYIQHSVVTDNANIWIAQREGRAKDGLDKTNPAILSMLALAKAKTESFGDYVTRANIVPVSISYEWDPCDLEKARELTLLQQHGRYEKAPYEDVQSIAKGISGVKGHVHLAFGQPLSADIDSVEEAATVLDQAILANYVLHPSNCVAYEMLEKCTPQVTVTAKHIPFTEFNADDARKIMQDRVNQADPQWREKLLRIYANPVFVRLAARAP